MKHVQLGLIFTTRNNQLQYFKVFMMLTWKQGDPDNNRQIYQTN